MSETFGNRLRALIKQQGLNQQELADALDVSRNTVWRWINDKATPESYILQNLATVLHVSVDSLFNDNQDNSDDWILSITVRQELKEEVIDLTKPIPEISTIVTANTGAYIALGGSYEHFADDVLFKGLIAQLKKMRDGVIQQGKANGAIPDDEKSSKKRR